MSFKSVVKGRGSDR